jgi:hypothetical protein
MKKNELREYYERIFEFFDCLNDCNNSPYETGDLGDCPISIFIDPAGKISSALGKKITNEIEEKMIDVGNDITSMAFGVGFVMGQLCELTYPGAKIDIKAFKKVIRDKGLLPYLPREKKAKAA